MSFPRIPRARPPVIPVGQRWYESTVLRVLAIVLGLAVAAPAVLAIAAWLGRAP